MIIPILHVGKLRFSLLAERLKARGDPVTAIAVQVVPTGKPALKIPDRTHPAR